MKNIYLLLCLLAISLLGTAQALKDDQQAVQQQINNLSEIIKTEPTAEHYYMRGYGYYNKGDLNRAIQDYDQAIAIDPQQFDYYYSRGMLSDKTSDFKAAVADYTKCIALDGSRAKSFFNRGYSRSMLKDFEGAIADYSACLARNSNHFAAYLNRGIILKNLNKQDLAIADFDRALELKPDSSDARTNRAICRAAMGRKDAIEDFNKVVQDDSQNPESYFNRALYFINYNVKGDYCSDLRKAEQYGYGAARKIWLEKCK